MPSIVARSVPAHALERLIGEGLHPLLARIYAARGVASSAELEAGLAELAPPETMLNLDRMARILADAIAARRRLLVVADYDADGATGCALAVKALSGFGAQVQYFVPRRLESGYGLGPEVAHLACQRFRPDFLITVDNGISSIEGVAEARRLGMRTLVTDHHLPGSGLPAAECIVNPNQPGCPFPSKHLSGVGVMFYLMIALRAELRARGAFREKKSRENAAPALLEPELATDNRPNLADFLDLVALGTVADVSPLDRNNRILVRHGLARIRAGRARPGIAALFAVAGRDPRRAGTRDLAFTLAPRLNAAGRLDDMALGIECLLAEEGAAASRIALELDRLNRERRDIEIEMQESALAALESSDPGEAYTLSLFDPSWHPGVIGIVAGRIRDRFHRPTIAFARAPGGELRGSGRSIPALHLRDALARVAVRHPGLLVKFGGHAAAAGLSLREPDLERFREAFEQVARDLLGPTDLERVIETDGSLAGHELPFEVVRRIENEAWGPGFPRPCFHDRFEVLGQRMVGERHLRLRLACKGRLFDAMLFDAPALLPPRIAAVHRPGLEEYQGLSGVRLTIEHWEADGG